MLNNKEFFFWPCSLFIFQYEELLGFKSFAKCAAQKLKITIHVHCYLQVKLFLRQQRIDLLLDAERRKDVTWRNERVNKNTRVLRRFVDDVCFLAKQ